MLSLAEWESCLNPNPLSDMKTLTLILLLSLSLVTIGCCLTSKQSDVPEVSLSNALVSVTTGLQAMREAGITNAPFGLYAKEVEVTFNLSASRENSSELKVDLSTPTGVPATVGLGAMVGSKVTSIRGNQITIKFSNLMDAHPEQTVVGKQGSEVITLIEALRAGGVTR